MKHLWLYVFSLIIIVTCKKTTDDCCTSVCEEYSTTNNCCSSPSTDCCRSQSRCCKQTVSCKTPCKNNCNNDDKQPSVVVTSGGEKNVHVNVTVPTDLTVSNVIRSETNVDVPLTMTFTNTNNIHISSQKRSDQVVTYTPPRTTPTRTPPTRPPVQSTTPCTSVVVTTPHSVPVPASNCCTVVIPCVHYGCQSHRQVCGNSCTSNLMYYPVNPCGGGGGCYRHFCQEDAAVDCSYSHCSKCGSDWFRSFDGFQRCGGCFSSKSDWSRSAYWTGGFAD